MQKASASKEEGKKKKGFTPKKRKVQHGRTHARSSLLVRRGTSG